MYGTENIVCVLCTVINFKGGTTQFSTSKGGVRGKSSRPWVYGNDPEWCRMENQNFKHRFFSDSKGEYMEMENRNFKGGPHILFSASKGGVRGKSGRRRPYH